MSDKEVSTVFKSFLKSLMRQLKALETAINDNNTEQAKKIIGELIEDIKSSIES